MHRLIVLILSAVDAAIAVAVGVAATLAPLTLLWVFGFGGAADWGTLWPAGATIWQFGNLVPLQVTLPGDYLAVVGIDPSAASFVLSLAPLAFAAFTAIFAARSGRRASQADAWITGVLTGIAVFAGLSALIAVTAANPLATVERWQAILLPTLVFAVPLVLGAVVTEWREAGSGAIARLRDRVEAAPHGWGEVPGLVARGTAVVVVGLIGLGALLFAVALILRGGEVIALFEAAHVDGLGATVVTLAQFAYLPTLTIWGLSFIAGPGFAVGTGTAVSPAGTQLGVVPGIPILGALPESTTPWLLLLALLPIAVGGFAGWICRSRLVATASPLMQAPPESSGNAALDALLSHSRAEPVEQPIPATPDDDPIGARLVTAAGIAVLAGAASALLAVLASGAIGPGRLTEVGPAPGPVALAVGVEVLIGAAILLLSPRRRPKSPAPMVPAAEERAPGPSAPTPLEPWAPERLAPTPLWSLHTDPVPVVADPQPETEAPEASDHPASDVREAPDVPEAPDHPAREDPEPRPQADIPTADLGPRRPQPLPPIVRPEEPASPPVD